MGRQLVKLQVRYFGQLQKEAGCAREAVETQAANVAELWKELAAKHGFTLEAKLIRAAQDDEFCAWEEKLASAEVVFMPPVAGG
jgi:molybdopterin converting factor small subunit